jgi:hypothetical protein
MGTSTEELSNEIARTRRELTYDVDALQDKVSPTAIMERRKSAVRGRLMATKDRVMGTGQSVMGSGRIAAEGVGYATSNVGEGIEDRVEGSPLAAGLVAFGAGMVIAGLIPATKAEAEGAQRLKEVAREHGEPVVEEVRVAAQEVGAQLKEKASEAVDELSSSAQDSAQHVREEAVPGSSSGSSSQPSGTAT